MNRYNRYYEVEYPIKYQLDYIEIMCLLEELWDN